MQLGLPRVAQLHDDVPRVRLGQGRTELRVGVLGQHGDRFERYVVAMRGGMGGWLVIVAIVVVVIVLVHVLGWVTFHSGLHSHTDTAIDAGAITPTQTIFSSSHVRF